jgi:hypothetical protein
MRLTAAVGDSGQGPVISANKDRFRLYTRPEFGSAHIW